MVVAVVAVVAVAVAVVVVVEAFAAKIPFANHNQETLKP